MRLGCEVTASDINPVAWFILKCTLEYPQKLAGQKLPLPSFVLKDQNFMESFFKAQGLKGASLKSQLEKLSLDKDEARITGFEFETAPLEADLAWHVRAWGWWVLQQAKVDLERFYPIVDGKPTVAYLWARTVKCKGCRATIPLLKTRWLCKKDKKRVVLTMEPNADKTGVVFGVETDVPVVGGNSAQKKAYDKKIGAGTMSKSGAKCPCCPSIMTKEDIRLEGKAGRLGTVMTTVAVDGEKGKGYRLPTAEEFRMAAEAGKELKQVFGEVPFGLPEEPTPKGGSGASRAFSMDGYGLDKWHKLFTSRQLLALATFVKYTRIARNAILTKSYSFEWVEAISAYLTCGVNRLVDFCNVNTQWKIDVPTINHALVRFAIQITWDFAEGNPIGKLAGSYILCLNRVATGLDTLLALPYITLKPAITNVSATTVLPKVDIIITDPPYYDAIPYSDLMDWFYIWLRRTVWDLNEEYSNTMANSLCPKWDYEKQEGELIDDASRHGGNAELSKQAYEDGMAKSFSRCLEALSSEGRLVIVFANKQPEAWETLVSSVIRAGFIVTGSWPIQTEQPSRTRGQSSAALSSSIWLVCKKRPATARPGWDNRVFEEMRQNITTQLRDFWDAGIRGPDFVWAATGPAMEAYSKYPVVKKASEPGKLLSVSEFLTQVRRLVLDFVVGRVLSETTGGENVSDLDDITSYYLLHRHDFGMEDSAVGACILYAVSCGLSDNALADQFDILTRTGGKSSSTDDDDEEEETTEDTDTEPEEGTGSKVKLKPWQQRKRKTMGYEAAGGRPVPLIDQVHRLMHLWKAGDVVKVDEYLDEKGLRRNALFHQLLQALIEMAAVSSDERALLESISNHIAARSGTDQLTLRFNDR